jgi:small subunit ribosomal protein S2
MNEIIKQLLEAGVHFGHQTRRWNPKMKRFIFGERGGIHIIDLEKTADLLAEARTFLKGVASQGGTVLFIGTKKQAQEIIEAEAGRCEMFYVRNRWMGGLLTNFETVKKSIAKLNDIERKSEAGIFDKLTKKEVAVLKKEQERLLRDIGGIRTMGQLPKAVFVIDTKKESIAIEEARKLGLTIVGMVDSNCDPDLVDYPIPANDDAVKAIKLITGILTDAIAEGRQEYKASGVAKAEPKANGQAKAEKAPVEEPESAATVTESEK